MGRVKPVLFSTGGGVTNLVPRAFPLNGWGGKSPGDEVEGSQFFWQGKNYSMSLLFCIYKQSYQSRLIIYGCRKIYISSDSSLGRHVNTAKLIITTCIIGQVRKFNFSDSLDCEPIT